MQFKFWKKKDLKAEVNKTFYPGPLTNSYSSVPSILNQQIASYTSPNFFYYLRLYQSVTPLANAVDLIATIMANVQLKLLDTKTKEYIDDAPILDLLNTPNELPNSSYCNFISETSKFFTITGNSFFIVTFSSRNDPLEIFVIPPQYITWEIGSDGYVESYTYSPQQALTTFVRAPDFRYLNRAGTQQLLHLKDFQPNAYNYHAFGLSRLSAILYELDQYEKSSQHNISLLANGARIGTLIRLKEEVTPDQEANLRAELQNIFVSQQNAGRPLVGGGIESLDRMAQSNEDMDFAKLKKMVMEAIYNRLQIPLALINSDSLSLANMQVARENLYDFAVLPQLKTILTFLSTNLSPYYKSDSSWKLTYDTFTIDSLRERSLRQLKTQASFNVMADNEIRDRMDMPDYQGGNEIYKPSNMLPAGNVDDMIERDEEGDQRVEESGDT